MAFKVVFHPAAEREVNDLFDTIELNAGPLVASRYVDSLLDFIESLAGFPKRGTVREGKIEGLGIIGYRRRLSIGIFAEGRNVTTDLLEERLS